MKHIFWVVIIGMILAGCSFDAPRNPGSVSSPVPSTSSPVISPATTPTPAAATPPNPTNSAGDAGCNIGLGLRSETIDIALENKDQIDFIMSASSSLAEQYFDQFAGAIRVIGAPSLDEIRQKGERASASQIPYEALAYGLETGKGTPDEEWQDLVGSTEKARALALEFDKLLVMGPGFKLLSENEEFYGSMGARADIWMLQTQQLQKGPPDSEYRREVERIVNLIRSENPDILIWAQITLPPDRVPDAEEWLAYRAEIMDLVDGSYIGVYTWEQVDQDQLIGVMKAIIEKACETQ